MTFFIAAVLLGLVPAFIAQSKGRSFAGWWLYGFLLFIIAIVHVLVIPPLNSQYTNPSKIRDCPFCAEPVLRQAVKCKHCGSALSPIPPSEADSDGTKIAWKRVVVLLLSLSVTYLIMKSFGIH